MLRPVEMSKVVIAGSKDYTRSVIETLHRLNILDITDFSEPEGEVRLGSPLENANYVSEKLIKIRSIAKILELDINQCKKTFKIKDLEAKLDNEINEIEIRLKGLADRRAFVEGRLKELAAKSKAVAPFVRLGLPFEVFSGYESIRVFVGVVKGEFEKGLQKITINYELMRQQDDEGIFIALFVPMDKGDEVNHLLSETGFVEVRTPELKGDPRLLSDEITKQMGEFTNELEMLKKELAKAKEECADFISASEEHLSIEIQKAEAPLRFATTANSFMIEGWIPSRDYPRLKSELDKCSSGRLHIERTRISYDEDAHEGGKETSIQATDGGHVKLEAHEVESAKSVGIVNVVSSSEKKGTNEGKEEMQLAQNGGSKAKTGISNNANVAKATIAPQKAKKDEDGAPVMLDNPRHVKPFEAIIELLSPPKYDEIDPTIFIFITFPLFFGMMIGDAGYGLVLVILGLIMRRTKFGYLAPVLTVAGLYTTIIGIFMFGEAFGMPFYDTVKYLGEEELNWSMLLGVDIPRSAVIGGVSYNIFGVFNKMLNVQSTLAIAIIIGILHIDIGLVLGFINERKHLGIVKAFCGKMGWIVFEIGFLLILGLMFNITVLGGYTVVGALAFIGASLGMIGYGEGGTALTELPGLISNILSYTRLVAVGLSKAGMAIAFNIIAFEMNILPGLEAGDYGMVAGGIVILIIGHTMIIVLGIIASGLHSLRLQYVEFFGKFYKGGGKAFRPFGHTRRCTEV